MFNPENSFSRVGKTANGSMIKTIDANKKASFWTGLCEEHMTEKHLENYLIKGQSFEVVFWWVFLGFFALGFFFCEGKACQLLE